MLDSLVEIEPGIFSLYGEEPYPYPPYLMLAVQPVLGMPLDIEGRAEYLRFLTSLGDKGEPARMYDIGCTAMFGLYECALVTLEDPTNIEALAHYQIRWRRGEYGPAQSFIVSMEPERLSPSSDFPRQLAAFLSRFDTPEIVVAGGYNHIVKDFLARISSATADGAHVPFGFRISQGHLMTPDNNPFMAGQRLLGAQYDAKND